MKIVNNTPFAAGGLFTTTGPGADILTAIVKGTFRLTSGMPADIAADQQPLSGDRHFEDDPQAAVRYEDDFAPFKPRADMLLVGQEPGVTGTFRVGAHAAILPDFAPTARASARRAEMAGPCGGDWFVSHWPRLAADCPWNYFNAAPPEMQKEGYLTGGEHLTLENLHPSQPLYRAQLPGLRIRCFLGAVEDRFEEIDMHLDTLWLDVVADVLVLVWRGRIEVEAADNPQLLAANERLAEPARPLAFYRDDPAFAESGDAVPPTDLAAVVDLSLVQHGIAPDSLAPDVRAFLANPEAPPFASGGSDMVDPDQVMAMNEKAASGDLDGMMAATMAGAGVPADALPVELQSLNAKAPPVSFSAPEPPDDAAAEPELPPETGNEAKSPAETPAADPDAELDAVLADKGVAPDSLPAAVRSLIIDPEASVAATNGTLDDPAVAAMLAEAGPETDEVSSYGGGDAPGLRRFDTPEPLPDWPPHSPRDAAAIADLATMFGTDRPPAGEGADFLMALRELSNDAASSSRPEKAQQE